METNIGDKPLVSIIIPVYNGENYLKYAIESALGQTYRNVEVIVVDDGSIDATHDICLSYGDKLRYFYQENSGVASAVNCGIKNMNGEYFSWLSHDDTYHKDKIEKQIYAALESGDPTRIVNGNYEIDNEIYHTHTSIRYDEAYGIDKMETSVFPILMTAFHGCVPLVHKKHFKKAGLFDPSKRLTQDFDFYFKALRGEKTIFLTEPLVNVRVHKEAGRVVSREFSKACSDQYIEFYKKMDRDELLTMFDVPETFLLRTCAMVMARGFRFDDADIPKPGTHTGDFHSVIEEVIGNRFENLYIYGMGFQGKTLAIELLGRSVNLAGFLDSNRSLIGSSWQGISCVDIEALRDAKGESLIIVSADDSDSVCERLFNEGFRLTVSRSAIAKALLRYAPTDWQVVT